MAINALIKDIKLDTGFTANYFIVKNIVMANTLIDSDMVFSAKVLVHGYKSEQDFIDGCTIAYEKWFHFPDIANLPGFSEVVKQFYISMLTWDEFKNSTISKTIIPVSQNIKPNSFELYTRVGEVSAFTVEDEIV